MYWYYYLFAYIYAVSIMNGLLKPQIMLACDIAEMLTFNIQCSTCNTMSMKHLVNKLIIHFLEGCFMANIQMISAQFVTRAMIK